MMNIQHHWEHIYQTKSPAQTSWYAPRLQTSLDWIFEALPNLSASIIDIGGGESTLVDDLLGAGYRDLTVLDLSPAALAKSQARLGANAKIIQWITGDVTEIPLTHRGFALWHDRAVFHFLTDREQREAYVRQLAASLEPGGCAILATFGPDGPEKCSGLPVRRYSAEALREALGPQFQLEKSATVNHHTPVRTTQQFLYCRFRLAER